MLLFTKCQETGQSEFQALLDWRNTPSEGMTTSPAQRLMGRRCKTLLPIAGCLLQPSFPTEQDTRDLLGRKAKQAHYYNRHIKQLDPIEPGDTIRMRLPGEQTWSAGTCVKTSGPRSYMVEVEGATFRRNRRQLVKTSEPATAPCPYPEPEPEPVVDATPAQPPVSPDSEASPSETPLSPAAPVTRRSDRERKPPVWLKDYLA